MVRTARRHAIGAVAAGLTLSVCGVATTGVDAAAGASPRQQSQALADAGSLPFTGTNTGAIPDGSIQCNNGVAGVRDVAFSVSGVGGQLTDVALAITITHTWAGDVSLVLIAPNGTQAPVMVIPGATTTTQCGYSSNFGGTYTFNDQATANIWDGLAALNSSGVLATGSFRASGPLVKTPVSLTAPFASLPDPNGGWILRVSDTSQFDTGTISAATLTLTGTSAQCQQAKAKVATAQATLAAAQAALAAATKTLDTKEAKLKKAKKKGDSVKIKKAKKAVRKAKAAVQTATAAVTAAQAAVTAAQGAQATAC